MEDDEGEAAIDFRFPHLHFHFETEQKPIAVNYATKRKEFSFAVSISFCGHLSCW